MSRRMLCARALLLTISLLSVLIYHVTTAEAQATIKLPDGYYIESGYGFDTLEGAERAPCVTLPPSATTVAAQQIEFELKQIDTYKQLTTFLGLSASISARGGIWNASAEGRYISTSELSSLHTTLGIRVTVRNVASPTNTRPRLSPEAARIRDPLAFFEQCGDTFVADTISGGEFMALIDYEADSASTTTDLRAQVSAAVGVFSGVKASAAFESKLQSVTKYTKRTITHFRKGPVAALPPMDVAGAIQYAITFPTLAATNPYPYEARLRSYSTIFGAPRLPSATININRKNLEIAAEAALSARMTLADVSVVTTTPYRFKFSAARSAGTEALRSSVPLLVAHINKAELAATQCLTASKPCAIFTEPAPTIVIPPWVPANGGCIAYSDAGACMECAFTSKNVDPNGVRVPSGKTGFDTQCVGMPAGASVLVTASGTVDKDGSGSLWMEAQLQLNQGACNLATSCRAEYAHKDSHYVSLNERGSADGNGAMSTRIFAGRCTAAQDGCSLVFGDDFIVRYVVQGAPP